MKEAFKNKKTYIIGGILLGAALLVSGLFLMLFLLPDVNGILDKTYVYVLYVFLAAYVLVGFLFWDLTRVNWRKKTKNYDGPVDDEIKINSWKSSMPIFLPALIILLIIIVCEIFFAFTGYYPFIG